MLQFAVQTKRSRSFEAEQGIRSALFPYQFTIK